MDKRPIGVFDSGIGGLTVLEEMVKIFKDEDFIYVGDQGHCPYGTKPNEEIEKCVVNVANYLLDNNVKAIVIACNTASFFIESVRKITNIPVISVIDPTCKYACDTTKNGKIAVLGTNATIKNAPYQKRISERNMESFPVPCSEFVDFVENHDIDDPIGEPLVLEKLSVLENTGVDTLIHGCTHFSLIEPMMRKVLGDINYVACGYPTSMELKSELEKINGFNEPHDRYVKIFTTGTVENALKTMKWFKAEHEEIKHINID